MTFEISRILLPSAEWKDHTALFVRYHNDCRVVLDGKYSNARLYEFNTYMNMFAAQKYYKYCDLGELYLKLHVRGAYHVQIIGSKRDHVHERIDTILVDTDVTSEKTEIIIPGAKDYEGVYFVIFEDEKNPVDIISAAWATDKAPVRKNRLAIVTCTFKREHYINKTIAVYEGFVNNNPELRERLKLFVVDNGKTLPLEKSNETTLIFHNKNAGGAGGFTRGLMEVCRLNDGPEKENPYTRVLFMDDDVEIIPETFYRTVVLSDYLKEDWKDSFVNGAMLFIERKNTYFESLPKQNGLWVKDDRKNLDVFNYDLVLMSNLRSDHEFANKDKKVDGAWWYCCFPIKNTTKNSLPLPVFFRGDDVEWSWREHGKHFISINGICVWHADFRWRVSLAAAVYYRPRNMFMINSIYTENFKHCFERYFESYFIRRLKTYDYIAIQLLLLAMDDILKGSNVFREDPEEHLKSVSQITKSIEWVDAGEDELEQAKHYFPGAGFKRKVVSKLTKWGRYCPDFLFSRSSIALEWYPPVDNFRLRREVKVYNLANKKYCIRRFDRKQCAFYEKEFYRRLRKMKERYEELKNDYKEAYKEFTSFAFWEKYLELS